MTEARQNCFRTARHGIILHTQSINTMDFDLSDLYYSRQQLQRVDEDEDDNVPEEPEDPTSLSTRELDAARRHFREFLRASS
jgi:hypothetical protein